MTSLRSRFPACVLLAAIFAAPTGAESFGAGVSVETPTPISELTADPHAFAGETVRVEGAVDAVCEMMGCWILLRDEGAEVRVKVPDGEIVFPPEAVGQRAAAQGEVRVVEMSRGEWIAWQSHLAEELGESYDDAAVGDGPFLQVQIAGTGAEIPLP